MRISSVIETMERTSLVPEDAASWGHLKISIISVWIFYPGQTQKWQVPRWDSFGRKTAPWALCHRATDPLEPNKSLQTHLQKISNIGFGPSDVPLTLMISDSGETQYPVPSHSRTLPSGPRVASPSWQDSGKLPCCDLVQSVERAGEKTPHLGGEGGSSLTERSDWEVGALSRDVQNILDATEGLLFLCFSIVSVELRRLHQRPGLSARSFQCSNEQSECWPPESVISWDVQSNFWRFFCWLLPASLCHRMTSSGSQGPLV